MNALTQTFEAEAQAQDILDVPMPAFFGTGSNNTLAHQDPETVKSVLANLEAHAY